jgi:hypothetical protein
MSGQGGKLPNDGIVSKAGFDNLANTVRGGITKFNGAVDRGAATAYRAVAGAMGGDSNTTSGLDQALQAHANKLHPVGKP